jgi:hypothetical protein
MGTVIITSNPTPTSPDSSRKAIVTEQHQTDSYREPIGPNKLVEFEESNISINVGDIVQCNITSASTCEITRVTGQATWAEGKVTQVDVPDADGHTRSEFQVQVLCEPNPFGKNLNDKLLFNNPTSVDHRVVKVGDTVAALTTTAWELCETSKVVQSV